MNRICNGKRKFVARFHFDQNQSANFSDTGKVDETDHVKTSRQRQVKAFLFNGLIFLAGIYQMNPPLDVAESAPGKQARSKANRYGLTSRLSARPGRPSRLKQLPSLRGRVGSILFLLTATFISLTNGSCMPRRLQ
jgi:hypothetical protein